LGWPDQTLDQLEGVDWGEPTYPSYVVTNSHGLRKKPLRDFTQEDLRFMLGQQISLSILMPMALDILEAEPWAAGDMYPGALLNMALRVDVKFWREHPHLWYRLSGVSADIDSMVSLLDEDLLPAVKAFRAAEPTQA
jgi:hypothetical protein